MGLVLPYHDKNDHHGVKERRETLDLVIQQIESHMGVFMIMVHHEFRLQPDAFASKPSLGGRVSIGRWEDIG